MSRAELSIASRQPKDVVVLHLDRAVAHDLLQALTQAVEPHSTHTGKSDRNLQKGGPLKGERLTAKVVKGKSSREKSPQGKAAQRKSAKGKSAKKSR